MGKTVVQINFRFEMTPEECIEAFKPLAKPIADVEGLLWKVWLMDEEHSATGGIYLFASPEAAQAYLTGPIITGLGQSPQFRDISVKVSGIDSDLSAITRGPIDRVAV
jgi:hypothetical protein